VVQFEKCLCNSTPLKVNDSVAREPIFRIRVSSTVARVAALSDEPWQRFRSFGSFRLDSKSLSIVRTEAVPTSHAGKLRSKFVMAAAHACGYFHAMTPTVEQRLAQLEKQVAELSNHLAETKPRTKDPWKTFGIFKDDPDYESAMKLGREWREAQTYEKEIAGS
jgi:hypothetical protein